MWNINVNAIYFDHDHDCVNMICELVLMKGCDNGPVLNKEECNAVISYLRTICFVF